MNDMVEMYSASILNMYVMNVVVLKRCTMCKHDAAAFFQVLKQSKLSTLQALPLLV